TIVDRERRTSVGRAEIGAPQLRELERGIGAQPDSLLQPTACRLPGRLQASAVDVVDPAVVAAADAALDRNTELERGPAMRAVQVQRAEAAAAIAKDDQVLAQDLHPQRRGRKLPDERHRLPEPAQ